jgi:hypothetical protein
MASTRTNTHQGTQTTHPEPSRAGGTPTPSVPKKTHRSPRDARLLIALLQAQGAAIDGKELGRMAGAANVWDLVMRARRTHGVTITSTSRQHIDRDGRPVRVGQYAITGDQAQAKAREVLASLGGDAGAA